MLDCSASWCCSQLHVETFVRKRKRLPACCDLNKHQLEFYLIATNSGGCQGNSIKLEMHYWILQHGVRIKNHWTHLNKDMRMDYDYGVWCVIICNVRKCLNNIKGVRSKNMCVYCLEKFSIRKKNKILYCRQILFVFKLKYESTLNGFVVYDCGISWCLYFIYVYSRLWPLNTSTLTVRKSPAPSTGQQAHAPRVNPNKNG